MFCPLMARTLYILIVNRLLFLIILRRTLPERFNFGYINDPVEDLVNIHSFNSPLIKKNLQ